MKTFNRYTFNSWQTEPNGPIKNIPVTGKEPPSEYMRIHNYLRERGWIREGGEWKSPYPPYNKYKSIYLAFDSQKFKDMVSER